MNAPSRIQLSRTKGWKLPPNTVVVSRPTKWGNPCRTDANTSRAEAVAWFRDMITNPHMCGTVGYPLDLEPLRGKNLACWCPVDAPCHADVLLEMANA